MGPAARGRRKDSIVPVVIETFTFLDCNANRDVALAWKEWVTPPGVLEILPSSYAICSGRGGITGAPT